MIVVVGLGNPDKKYEQTIHNTGFRVLDELARRNGLEISIKKCKAIVGEGMICNKRVALCKPQTYMNLSGESVVQLKSWYKPEYDQLIVVYDDIDLPFGKIRFRSKGSAGTHNGMRNIVELTGTQDIARVRVGVGRPPEFMDLADYVLSRFSSEQSKEEKNTLEKAAKVIETYIESGAEAAQALTGK